MSGHCSLLDRDCKAALWYLPEIHDIPDVAQVTATMTSRTDPKIRSRLLAHKFRNKLPDFKDILRERFKARIKQNRRTFFDRMRSSNEADEFFQDTLSAYLQDEMSGFAGCCAFRCDPTGHLTSCVDQDENNLDIERELEIMKQIEDELIQEQLCWILEEYRKAEEELPVEQTPKLVCCPVCQNGFLRITAERSLVTCAQCPMQLHTSFSLDQIETIVSQALNEHAAYCHSNPQFAVVDEPNSSGLFVICSSCSLFNALS